MKALNRVLLLTSHFPYLPGEQFLRYELPAFANLFEKVELLPTDSSAASIVQTLPASILPRNVSIRFDGMALLQQVKTWHQLPAMEQLWPLLPLFQQAYQKWQNHPFARAATWQQQVQYTAYMAKYLLCASRMVWCLQRMRDVPVHLFGYWLNAATFGAASWAQQHGHLMLARAHGADLYPDRLPMGWQPLHYRSLALLEGVLCVSLHGQQQLQTYYPQFASKVRTVRIGVPESASLCPCSQDGKLRLLTIGNLVPVKRMERLIAALMYCSMPVRWTHVGYGQQGPFLQQCIRHLPTNITVRWLGQLPSWQIIALLKEGPWDLFLNTSESEGFPVTVMEALAVGLPVVAAPVGGLTDLFPLHTDLFVRPDCPPRQLATCLRNIYHMSQQQRAVLQQRAKQMWHSHFQQSNQVSLFQATCRQLYSSMPNVYPSDAASVA